MPRTIRLYDSSDTDNDAPPYFLSVPDDFKLAAEWMKYIKKLAADRQPLDEGLGPHEAAQRLDATLGLEPNTDQWRTEDLFVRYLRTLPGVTLLKDEVEIPEFYIDALPHYYDAMLGRFRVNGPTPEN